MKKYEGALALVHGVVLYRNDTIDIRQLKRSPWSGEGIP